MTASLLITMAAGTAVGWSERSYAADSPIQAGIHSLQSLSRVLRGDAAFIPVTQAQFDSIAGDLGAATDVKAASASLPLGHGGIRLGLLADRTTTDASDLWASVSGERYRALLAPRLSVAVGLGARVNAELAAMRLTGHSVHVTNGAVTMSLLDESQATPHVALRISLGRLGGIDDVRLRTAGLELIAARRLGPVTGYWGGGAVQVAAKYSGDAVFRSSQTQGKAFVGIEGGSAQFRAGFEVGLIDSRPYQTLRLSYRF